MKQKIMQQKIRQGRGKRKEVESFIKRLLNTKISLAGVLGSHGCRPLARADTGSHAPIWDSLRNGVKPGELSRMEEAEGIHRPRTCGSTQRGLSAKRQVHSEDGRKVPQPGKQGQGMEEKQEQNGSRVG